jgi:anti-sigma regulatory factor (Ser/Thr protein kinase)
MANNTIKIPNVKDSIRIGYSFNYLIGIINDTEKSDGDVSWDFSSVSFLHPFFLAALSIYKNTCSHKITCINLPDDVKRYLENVRFLETLHFENESEDYIRQLLDPYLSKKYTPICSFAMCDSNKDVFESIVRDIIIKQSNADDTITNPLSFFFSELIDNINEHSKSKNGYMFSQYLERERCLNICIADNGITVLRSFDHSDYVQEVGGDEANALRMANEGYSTKDLPDAENRGYGIPTTKRMLVEGLKGSFFMLSGGAFHRYDHAKNNIYVDISKIMHWSGTIILLKIPIDVPPGFNYLNYI